MNKKIAFLVAIVGVFFYVATSPAGSLENKKKMAKADQYLQTHMDDANKRCGTSIKASIDWSSFTSDKAFSYTSRCAAGADAINFSFCGSSQDLEKEAVKEGIKEIVCKFSEDVKEPIVTLKDGVLSFTWGLKSGAGVQQDVAKKLETLL